MTVCLGLGRLWGGGALAFPRLAPRRRFPQIVSNCLILSLASLVIRKKNGFILASSVSNRVLEAVFMLRQRRYVSGQKQNLSLAPFVRAPAIIHYTITFCISRNWLQTICGFEPLPRQMACVRGAEVFKKKIFPAIID